MGSGPEAGLGGRGTADEPVPMRSFTPRQLEDLVAAARDLVEYWPRGTVQTTQARWQITFDEQHERLRGALAPFAAFARKET